MALSQVGIGANITWQLTKAVTGFTDVMQGSESAAFASNSLSTTTWDAAFLAQYTILAAGTQAVDLRTFTDLVGTSVTADKAMGILLIVTGAVGDTLNVKPHGTDGLVWFFENASYGVNIPGGGMFMFCEGSSSTGTTVDATHRQFLLTNNGAASLTVKVVAVLSDV